MKVFTEYEKGYFDAEFKSAQRELETPVLEERLTKTLGKIASS